MAGNNTKLKIKSKLTAINKLKIALKKASNESTTEGTYN